MHLKKLFMEEIFKFYLGSQYIKKIVNKLETTHRINFKRIIGSSKSFVLSALHKISNKSFLICMDNHVDAAYLYNDIEKLLGKEKVFILPTSLHRSFITEEVRGIDTSNLLLRTEVLSNIVSKRTGIIISYSSAIAEMVVSPKDFETYIFQIKVGDIVDIETLEFFLLENNFQRVDFVFEPGQYALRGSIVDIFSFDADEPYRIEFFGDEIESIRTFNISNQLSINNLELVKIVPDINTRIEEKKINFLEFLSDNYILVFNDLQLSLDFIKNNSEKNFSLEDKYGNNIFVEYVSYESFFDSLSHFRIIELSNLPVLAKDVFEFNISSQQVLQKNFKLFAEILRELQSKNYKIFILSRQRKQLQRIREILDSDEIGGKDIDFTPINEVVYEGFIDNYLKLAVLTDHQIFGRYHRFHLKNENFKTKQEAIFIQELQSLKPGDYVVHDDHGIGKFAGLTTINNNGVEQEVIRIVYKDNDSLFVPIHALHKIRKYKGKDGLEPKISKLGTGVWQKLKQKAKKKVKDIAKDLIKLYAERMKQQGFAFSPDTYLQEELEASFIYEDTPDQSEATKAVKEDMEKKTPMDRLICGDVGFGKTEIAVRAAFKAVADNKQVALLCPTTVLALQHYKTFSQRLKDFPVTIDYLTRLKTVKEQKQIIERLSKGEIDIIIGTHRLLSKDIKFKDLGLLIIDEEQKFGVAAKERLRQLKVNIDTLTLTATPIPRTLQFSLMGARDLSIIKTPPPNRRPIITELHTFDKTIIKKAICYELQRNGQVFFVHNHVDTLAKIANYIKELCPEAKVAIAHGKMKPSDLEKVINDFINYDFDILVTTTIIENGLDIPNANTIIINDAHRFGLSDLHQLRGRVGRSARQAFCYLLAPPKSNLTEQARRRLTTIEQFVELGSGFNIALQDLDIRGAGNLLGAEQSGFINDMGFETFKRVLEEAILELKTEEFKDLFKEEVKKKDFRFVSDCQISTDFGVRIPTSYISDDKERLRIYHRLNSLEKEEEVEKFKLELQDRFGQMPNEVEELINIVKLRWLAMDLGMEKLVLKNNLMLCYFVSDKNSAFYDSHIFTNLMSFIANKTGFELKQKTGKLYLKIPNIKSITEAMTILKTMKNIINEASTSDKT